MYVYGLYISGPVCSLIVVTGVKALESGLDCCVRLYLDDDGEDEFSYSVMGLLYGLGGGAKCGAVGFDVWSQAQGKGFEYGWLQAY